MAPSDSFKVVINPSHGGFALSEEAEALLDEKKRSKGLEQVDYFFVSRDDPELIEVVEELKSKANGEYSHLQVISVPSEFQNAWFIHEYDGAETLYCSVGELLLDRLERLPAVTEMSALECQSQLSQLKDLLVRFPSNPRPRHHRHRGIRMPSNNFQ